MKLSLSWMHEFWWSPYKHPWFISLANEFSFEEKLVSAIISAYLFGAKCQHRAVCQSEKTCSVRPYIRLKLFSRRLCRALVGSPTWQKSPNLDCDQIVSSKLYINFTPGRTFRSNFCSLTVSIKFSCFYKVISTRWHTASRLQNICLFKPATSLISARTYLSYLNLSLR